MGVIKVLIKVVFLIFFGLILGCSHYYSDYKSIKLPGRLPIKIAILDSGCNIPYKEGISFVDNNLVDKIGHGTRMAEIIKKMNPQVELYIAKVIYAPDGNPYSPVRIEAVVSGIYWAVSRNVDIINMSFQIEDNKVVHWIIQEAYKKGIILVAAAGTRTLIDEIIDESQGGKDRNIAVQCPAKYSEVIAIGAVDLFNRLADYSAFGKEIEFVCKGSYKGYKGTSPAAAYATGIISKIREDWPKLDVEQFRKKLQFYAQDLGKRGRDKQFGYGKLRYIAKTEITRDYQSS